MYTSINELEYSTCLYCDEPAIELDHVPAISLVENMNIEEYISNGGEFLLYPSCTRCNRYLSNCNATGGYERLLVLESKYLKRVNKLETWSDKDLGVLGHTLRSLIESKRIHTQLLTKQLAVIQNKLYRMDIGELSDKWTSNKSSKNKSSNYFKEEYGRNNKEMVNLIVQLRDKGYTFNEVINQLNFQGFRTKRGIKFSKGHQSLAYIYRRHLKQVTNKEKVDFLEPLITCQKYTEDELMKKMAERFPKLTYAKNVEFFRRMKIKEYRYTYKIKPKIFDRWVVINNEGKIGFIDA